MTEYSFVCDHRDQRYMFGNGRMSFGLEALAHE
ncbi:MAG: hypothetical protein JWQ10_117 [Herbaspirillum sp.]|nr:hypothetical protein [Herbaspirillum sp.]